MENKFDGLSPTEVRHTPNAPKKEGLGARKEETLLIRALDEAARAELDRILNAQGMPEHAPEWITNNEQVEVILKKLAEHQHSQDLKHRRELEREIAQIFEDA